MIKERIAVTSKYLGFFTINGIRFNTMIPIPMIWFIAILQTLLEDDLYCFNEQADAC